MPAAFEIEPITFHTIWRETDTYLETLSKCAREGKRLDEASGFARWLQFSGVLGVLKLQPANMPLPNKPDELERKMRALIMDCGDAFRGGVAVPKYAESDIAAISAKLDALLAKAA